jgi:hypothetical protein
LLSLLQFVSTRVTRPTVRFDVLNTPIEDYINNAAYLGYSFENGIKEAKLPVQEEQLLRKRCTDFTVALSKELQERLPVNIKTLQHMSLFSVEETLKHNKGREIIQVAELLGFSAERIDRILSQWNNIHLQKWIITSDTVQFWAEVLKFSNAAGENPYADLCDLAITVLSLPHSNAQIERVFSQMNIVKSKLRNRMALPTLNAILRIRYGLKILGHTCQTYTIPASHSICGNNGSVLQKVIISKCIHVIGAAGATS